MPFPNAQLLSRVFAGPCWENLNSSKGKGGPRHVGQKRHGSAGRRSELVWFDNGAVRGFAAVDHVAHGSGHLELDEQAAGAVESAASLFVVGEGDAGQALLRVPVNGGFAATAKRGDIAQFNLLAQLIVDGGEHVRGAGRLQ